MVGIALLGAGIFARKEHLPAIEASPALFELKAVYSRSQASAEALAAASRSPASVAVYFDEPAAAGKSLDDLLARTDVAAVVVALPILSQPAVVQKALAAGKHVLSEKPVAGDLAAARELIAWYAALPSAPARPIFAVAENFRFWPELLYAADELRKIGGDVATFSLKMHQFVKPDNNYLNTPWRKTPEHQGGFVLDGGVHFVAALRLLLGAAGHEVKQLVGFSGLLEARLPPVDTVTAVALTQGGKSGTIAISFGTEFKAGLEVEVVTTQGAVVWEPKKVRTFTRAAGEGDGPVEVAKTFAADSGVAAEVAAFGQAIAAGAADPRQTPEEALKDLEILQRLLESGAGGATLQTIQG
ncbi:oxidoreductase-like protein [Lasiosphaeria ovina]|uniref:Oxidoreductase-like protein n=1 Tax=Lasiosphaeria ovina TaxID=92902 RepID=A0AAE0JTM9_9PEZI|nr:oxidoreductase-like protein [Lasiosphaeria ovina]